MKLIIRAKLIIIFVFLFSISCYSQNNKFGVSVSLARISLTDNYHVTFSWPNYHVKYFERKLVYWSYGIYFPCLWNIDESNQIVFKPGAFYSKRPFSGIELGLMYKRIFFDDYKVGLGLNVNIHEFYDWLQGWAANTTIDFSIERRIIKDTFLGLSFHKPFNKNFGHSADRVIGGEIITSYSDSSLDYMIKVYIEYYF